MKTLTQLMRTTPRDVQVRASHVRVWAVKVKYVLKKQQKVMIFTATCYARTDKVFYDITIELYPKDIYEQPSLNIPAWVKCSCPHFLFRCEWALAKVGSSEIDYSNGKPPYITNPQFTPQLCKHLFAASPLIIRASQKLAKKAIPDATKEEPEKAAEKTPGKAAQKAPEKTVAKPKEPAKPAQAKEA